MDNIVNHSDFADISEDFKMIDDSPFTIIIPQDDGEKLCNLICGKGIDKSVFRRLGLYSVSVYKDCFDQLISSGRADMVSDTTAILTDLSVYDHNLGICQDNLEGGNLIF